jgi:hypothetical protein
MTDSPEEAEARATYRRYVATRAQIMAGELPWSALNDYFTDDAVFLDPAWGRTQGKEELHVFFDASMRGLEDWEFPEEFTMVEGHRVVSFWWNRLPGARPDGSPYQAPGVSILHYAGDGRFSYELDLLNMAELGEHLTESGWTPSPEMNFPPANPDRNPKPPDRDGP